ncbi:MAG: TROVE domain-containing protein [Deltaproteobacteria bacterium]|nr:TROVE domain-containing protein [Deltaproteobacteria bacterium]
MALYSNFFRPDATVGQDQALPGQVANHAGGHAWPVDDWARLDRFLVLGSEGGTLYVSERKLTADNVAVVQRCLAVDGARVVARIVELSEGGRAPKQAPAILALACAAKRGDDATRAAAYAALPRVCRTGTHLMHFAEYAQLFGGWGRGMRRAMASWFNARPADALAYQLVKYQARDGWSTRDLLRLAHPRAASPSHDRLFHWVVKGALDAGALADPALALVAAFERAKRATSVAEIVALVRDHKLPREAVPTVWLREAAVWEALLVDMPLGAMVRNLATMTRVGLIATGASATAAITARLADTRQLSRARLHPVAILAALTTYQRGHGARGDATWTPVAAIVDALDGAFYQSFRTIVPSGRRTLLALDVSGSMSMGEVAGVPGLTPRLASAAMALCTAATERDHGFVAFTGGGHGSTAASVNACITELDISPRQRLDDVVRRVSDLPFGATDCALPMVWAQAAKRAVDVFVIYTDSETWAGSVHPAAALRAYRQATGIAAKLIVVGMTSNGFTIADPDDAGMLDVVGFDTATPAVIADVARA